MAKIINLRQASKTRKRSQKRAQGDENAARFGRSSAEKRIEKDREERLKAHLDQHKRDR